MNHSSHVEVTESTNYVEVVDDSVVVIDSGRRGPAGPVGPQGPPGDSSEALAFLHTQLVPATLVQVHHELGYQPAGYLCVDTSNSIVIPGGIAYPAPGYMEFSFGFGFTGTIRVS